MIIEGGKPLAGEITVSGSKNAALPILIASIMAPGRFEFHDVPDLMDIHTTAGLLRELGAEVDHQKTFIVDSTPITTTRPPGTSYVRCVPPFSSWEPLSRGSEGPAYRCPVDASWVFVRSINT